jgi:putative transposase
MYNWRKLTPEIREKVLENRRSLKRPWHSPPHQDWGLCDYHVSAACYEHQPFIGYSPERMSAFEMELLEAFDKLSDQIDAWCILPNHYHALIRASAVKATLHALGKLHGRTSYQWNGEEKTRGRKTWHNAVERAIRSERHFWATMNYVHHQPVHHHYVEKWQDWPYSSAGQFLQSIGEDEACEIWKKYPILDYGKGWDDDRIER